MRIQKIEWRNIFSYGDDQYELDFGEKGQLWQLSGVSGSGKSSLLTIPKLLLFGKTEGSDGHPVSVTEIANRINKKGWIRGTILKGNDTFVIERNFSPSGLTIYKNGENLDKAGIKNMQGIIDTDILDGMPYHIFANVMTLSLNNFKSFISMTPADKRAIIDKIFSMEIINKVYELVKKDRKELGNSINISNSQIYTFDQTIRTSQIELERLNEQNVEENPEDKLQAINQKLAKVAELYQQQSAIYADNYPQYTELENTERQINMAINSESIEINHLKQKINLFNQDKCPTCGTPFNSGEFDHIKDELNKSLVEREDTMQKYSDGLVKLREKKNSVSATLAEIQSNMNKITAKQNELISEYRAIEAVSKQSTQTDAIQKIIDSTNESKAKLEKSIEESNSKMKLLDIMEELYSVDGIKQTLMGAYIPTLNAEIEKTLEFLGFPYTLTFDNNFDPHLEDLGKEIKPQSLSTGEHKKVDLTVLCSLLKMLKIKYPQINLVCLDETVSSLDYVSSTEIIKYLKEISTEMDLNIFIVSHTQLDENLFDRHILAEKPAEYTILKEI